MRFLLLASILCSLPTTTNTFLLPPSTPHGYLLSKPLSQPLWRQPLSQPLHATKPTPPSDSGSESTPKKRGRPKKVKPLTSGIAIDARMETLQSELLAPPSSIDPTTLIAARDELLSLRTAPTFELHSLIARFYQSLTAGNMTAIMEYMTPCDASLSVTFPNLKGTVRGFSDVKESLGGILQVRREREREREAGGGRREGERVTRYVHSPILTHLFTRRGCVCGLFAHTVYFLFAGQRGLPRGAPGRVRVGVRNDRDRHARRVLHPPLLAR